MTLKNTDTTIRTAKQSDIDTAIKILKANFINDPILVWIIDNHAERTLAFDDFFHMYVTAGINNGVVNIVEAPDMGIQ